MKMKRPHRHAEGVIALAADRLADAYLKHFSENCDKADLEEAFIEMLRSCSPFSHTFEYAMMLKGEGWEIDADVFDWLDENVDGIWESAYLQGIREWALFVGLSTDIRVDDTVEYEERGQKKTGIVIRVHGIDDKHSPAELLVYCPQDGHVRSGIGVHGTFVVWEKASRVQRVGGAA